ncbi:MAG: hypothetical protein H6622_16395 [Halobacteriovoraceae bacterium]|nr:hypothetical protein [Halobacteriovoraceae bacterium]
MSEKHRQLELEIEKIQDEILKFVYENPEFSWIHQQVEMVLETNYKNEIERLMNLLKLMNEQVEYKLISAIEVMTKALNNLNHQLEDYENIAFTEDDGLLSDIPQQLSPSEKIKFVH